MNAQNVQDKLEQSGLLEAGLDKQENDQERRDSLEIDAPWYIRLMLAFSGWLAAIFLLVFLFTTLTVVFDKPAVGLGCGTALLAGAYLLIRRPKNDFMEHLGLAISLAGQVLLSIALYELLKGDQENFFWLILILLQAGLVLLMPSFLHRSGSTMGACLALWIWSGRIHVELLVVPLLMAGMIFCWLDEFSVRSRVQIRQAIGYGLVLSLISIQSGLFFGWRPWRLIHEGQWWGMLPWLGQALISVVFLFFTYRLVRIYSQASSRVNADSSSRFDWSRLSLIVMGGAIFFCLCAWNIPGLVLGVMITLLGFSISNRLLQGLGISALLSFLSAWYYRLEITLLEKSGLLLLTAIGLLLAVWLIGRLFSAQSVQPEQDPLPLVTGEMTTNSERISSTKFAPIFAVLALVCIVLFVNMGIMKREKHLAQGHLVYLELAPVDPRSLMQGDYMALRFQLASDIFTALHQGKKNKQEYQALQATNGLAVVHVDSQKIGTFVRLSEERADTQADVMSNGELALQYRLRKHAIKLATNAYFFQEGHGALYESARYGAFRVNEKGELLLEFLADEHLTRLGAKNETR